MARKPMNVNKNKLFGFETTSLWLFIFAFILELILVTALKYLKVEWRDYYYGLPLTWITKDMLVPSNFSVTKYLQKA